MTSLLEYKTFVDVEDVKDLGVIVGQAFVRSASASENFFKLIGLENLRVICREGKVAGGLATVPMGMWLGGQSVPMVGIASVGIAPEYRGGGVAIALMQNMLQELYAKGTPISVLYPATQQLYRKAGYEQAGNYCTWEISTQDIHLHKPPLALQPIADLNCEILHQLYQQQAQLIHGYLDRNSSIWKRVTQLGEKETVYGYLIGNQDQPEGYIILSQHYQVDHAVIKIRDWVVLSHAAAQTFWSFLANHRSTIKKVTWQSSIIDSLTLVLPEQTAKIKHQERWMLRIVDVYKALQLRGYKLGVETELHLAVKDDLLTGNNDKFILSVANGQGEVKQGGKGELQIDIQGLASLYTGLFTPHTLKLAGKLEAPDTALLAATEIFTSSAPWMADFF
ncbi:GNAT family N-acetyltransferase [Nostoc spongiaeforme FACHB-130]|uniref:GNAT family N-acetyltransferase n=1 Tax=Nostoc spongiaeforme FACHB-130 TaxID=1357510 RepID=A0ABR8FTZ2_9NOSO|nr:GNAT family N-acetyltransferase [Nostoc spongiaeforme]MBD2593785.1 GNAT family N-acetyltransferase [Nostoc spongiaeforme FACHB-130]